MNWLISVFRKITGVMTDIGDRVWKSILNKFKKEDGKVVEVSTSKKAIRVILILLVLGVFYRMITNKENFSAFDRYNIENKPPFEVGKTIGNDAASREYKVATERELRDSGTTQPQEEVTQDNTIGSSVFALTPQDANKFSCGELVKKIQRSEGLSSPERIFFKACSDKKLLPEQEIAGNLYEKISDKDSPLTDDRSKNVLDAVTSKDGKDKELVDTANKGILAPTGSKEQEMSFGILDWLPSFTKEGKDKVIALSKQGNHEEATKIIEEEVKANPSVSTNKNENNNNASSDTKAPEANIKSEPDSKRRENVEEAARITGEKNKAQNELNSVQNDIKSYGLADQEIKDINDGFIGINPNMNEEEKRKAYSAAMISCEAKLAGNPKAKEICSKFKRKAELESRMNEVKDLEISFLKRVGKDPYTYLRFVATIKNGPTAVNGSRFIPQNEESPKKENSESDLERERLRKLEEEENEKNRLLLKIDPDIYRTKKLLQLKRDLRDNVTNITGEAVDPQQKPELKVSDAIFYTSQTKQGVVFPVNVKVSAVLAEMVYCSDQNLGDKPIHLRTTSDLFDPKTNKIIVHKGAVLSGRATSLEVETKTLLVSFTKITDGPESNDIQLSVAMRGAAWDTQGKQITSAVVVDYISGILDKVNSDAKGTTTDQALLDVINQQTIGASTSAVQKIAQKLANDLQNAKKLFFAPEGAKITIYP